MKRLIAILPIAVFLLVASFASWACPKGLKYNDTGGCVDNNGKVIAGYVWTGDWAHDNDSTYVGFKAHYDYAGTDYTARSTAGRKVGIVVDRKRKRGKKGSSIKLTFNPRKCIVAKPGADDCEIGSKRTQLQTNHWYPTNKALVFNFSVWKNKVATKSTWDTGPLFFELKPEIEAELGINHGPTLKILLHPKTREIQYVISNCKYKPGVDCSGPKDIVRTIGKWRYGKWHDFKIETNQTPKANGYVRVTLNGKSVLNYKGKTTDANYAKPTYWLGPYLCGGCNQGGSIASNEPNHSFWFDKVSSEIVTGFEVTTPNGGEKWKTKKKYAIRWNKGKAGTYVKIQLLKKGRLYRTIAAKTKNDGKHAWRVPSTLVKSAAYKVKITSTKNKKLTDSSDNNFTITK